MTSDRRQRQKEAKAAARERQRKAAARRELLRRVGVAVGLGGVVAIILLAFAFFGGDEEELPEGYAAFRAQPTACGAEAPAPVTERFFDEPIDQVLDPEVRITATVETSCGSLTIELDQQDHPETVNSFVFLARQDYYDGVVFHRIVEDFVIQGGDPTATGTGGPGYVIPDEFPQDDFVYEDGVVAMANAGRGSTGSQFFVVVGDQAGALTPSFNVLGRVIEGSDVLDRIAEVPVIRQPGTREQSYPTESVYIEDVTIQVDA